MRLSMENRSGRQIAGRFQRERELLFGGDQRGGKIRINTTAPKFNSWSTYLS